MNPKSPQASHHLLSVFNLLLLQTGHCLADASLPGISVLRLPPGAQTWKERAQWLANGFVSNSKQATSQMQSLLQFLNGDTVADLMCHYCLPGCCASDDEAFERLLRMLIPLVSRSYPLPLLYRFKNYSPASSFMKTFCCLHNFLPRVLSQMHTNSTDRLGTDAASNLGKLLDGLLDGEGKDQDSSHNFQSVVSDLLDNDLGFMLQNSARRHLVLKEVGRADFCNSAFLIDILTAPMEYGSNLLFKRTSILTKLSTLSKNLPDYAELAATSRRIFLQIVTGELGRTLIASYAALLDLRESLRMGLDPSGSTLELLFQQVLVCTTDCWRRLVRDFDRYPFKLFSLLSIEPDDTLAFVNEWRAVADIVRKCKTCVDFEFTSQLLEGVGPLFAKPHAEQAASVAEVRGILEFVATFSPVNADSVEVKHGQLQWTVSKRGGQYVKKGRSATEFSLLRSAIIPNCIAQCHVGEATRPPATVRAAIQRQAGVSLKNANVTWLDSFVDPSMARCCNFGPTTHDPLLSAFSLNLIAQNSQIKIGVSVIGFLPLACHCACLLCFSRPGLELGAWLG